MSMRPTTRRERLAIAESRARAAGYTGQFPPTKPRIVTGDDFEGILGRVEAGEHRAGFVHALGEAAAKLTAELKPEHFTRLGERLVAILDDQKATARVKLRACQALVKPLRDAVELMRRLKRDTPRGDHLASCVDAFIASVGEDQYARIVQTLRGLAQGQRTKDAAISIRAAETLVKLIHDMAEVSRGLAGLEHDSTATPDAKDPRLKLADEEFSEMERQIHDGESTGDGE